LYYPAQAQAYYTAYVNALAAMTVPMDKTSGVPFIPVKIFNVKTDKIGATVNMMVDTGAMNSNLSFEYVKPLGIDLTSSLEKAQSSSFNKSWTSYKHYFKIQVGGLKPMTSVPMFVADTKLDFSLLGWRGVLQRVKLEVFGGLSTPQLKYEELAVAALGRAGAYFRSRI
jgi:hypothetical protein